MAAISPDVVVPNMLRLQEAGRGVNHGIPTMAMTACSMDDLVTMTGFGLAFMFAFSNWNINDGCRAPSILMLRAIGGGVVGGFLGFILWFIPPPGMVSLRGEV
ncbi:unnamed protein product [Dibothriocephalus latus]|uniref:Cation/H+ exchanger domain-containing protein n=1 Tax=Dibothriocephalus latus TaxID=60516 RepID=A0A3P6P924_DIBLA|nr:unnamed protein product [Dibothriocephalus latus]